MNAVTMMGPLFDGGPTMVELEDEGSVWFVRDELRELYLAEAQGMTRARVREIETNVRAGLDGRQTIRSSWLLGLRAEARAAAGLEAIPLDRIGDYRVVEAWPSELASSDGITGWALHQSCVDAAVDAARTLELQAALEASTGAVCQSCRQRVASVCAGLCEGCTAVLEVVRLERAGELGRQRVEGRTTRLELVERWLDGR